MTGNVSALFNMWRVCLVQMDDAPTRRWVQIPANLQERYPLSHLEAMTLLALYDKASEPGSDSHALFKTLNALSTTCGNVVLIKVIKEYQQRWEDEEDPTMDEAKKPPPEENKEMSEEAPKAKNEPEKKSAPEEDRTEEKQKPPEEDRTEAKHQEKPSDPEEDRTKETQTELKETTVDEITEKTVVPQRKHPKKERRRRTKKKQAKQPHNTDEEEEDPLVVLSNVVTKQQMKSNDNSSSTDEATAVTKKQQEQQHHHSEEEDVPVVPKEKKMRCMAVATRTETQDSELEAQQRWKDAVGKEEQQKSRKRARKIPREFKKQSRWAKKKKVSSQQDDYDSEVEEDAMVGIVHHQGSTQYLVERTAENVPVKYLVLRDGRFRGWKDEQGLLFRVFNWFEDTPLEPPQHVHAAHKCRRKNPNAQIPTVDVKGALQNGRVTLEWCKQYAQFMEDSPELEDTSHKNSVAKAFAKLVLTPSQRANPAFAACFVFKDTVT